MTDPVPLCVDLDGTLVHTDLLHESALLLARQHPADLLRLPGWLAQGKAVLKARMADRVCSEAPVLPYAEDLLAWLRAERHAGRRLVLCTASDARWAQAVADHLGIFDEVLASDGKVNLAGEAKAAALMQRFGKGGYDYVGNGAADRAPWAGARRAIWAGPASAGRIAASVAQVERGFPAPQAGWRDWLRGLRLHQWLKNVLLLLPLLGAHRFGDVAALGEVALAFLAFGSCASAVYVVNDIFDLESDRHHPRKRLRPFASGRIAIPAALAAVAVLLVVAASLALLVSRDFAACLLAYLALTTAYTFVLKSLALVDCLALAGLYTLRVIAGGAAAAQPVSSWLLAFCLFLFLSLAFVKRFAELLVVAEQGKAATRGRGYLPQDRVLVKTFGVASGFSAVLVLALYLNSDAVLRLYTHPERFWLAIPIVLYWIQSMWLRAARGQMHDDPVVFAVRDRASLIAGALFVAALALAR